MSKFCSSVDPIRHLRESPEDEYCQSFGFGTGCKFWSKTKKDCSHPGLEAGRTMEIFESYTEMI